MASVHEGPGLVTVLAILLISAGAARAQEREEAPSEVPVTVVLAGDDAATSRIRATLTEDLDGLPVTFRIASLPNAPADRPPPPVDESLANARARYVEADFAGCLEAAGGDEQVVAMLGAGARLPAARILFWRVACRVGAGDLPEARRLARDFAVLGLDVPADVEAVSPEVEAVLARVRREVEALPRAALHVQADAERARASMDGRDDVCVVPCTFELAPGTHVVVLEGDGVEPAHRRVVLPASGATVTIDTTAASPERAAQQWTRRYATSAAIDSAASVSLLAQAVRARRLVLLSADEERAVRLRGVLAVEGVVAARAERPDADPDAVGDVSVDLLQELLVEGEVLEPAPTLLEQPLFWVAVGVVAAGAAAATAAFLFEPETRTEVRF